MKTSGGLDILQIDAFGHSQPLATLPQVEEPERVAATPAGLWIEGLSATGELVVAFLPDGQSTPRLPDFPGMEEFRALAPFQGCALVAVVPSSRSRLLRLCPQGDVTRLLTTSIEVTALAARGRTYYLGGQRDGHGLLAECRAGRCVQHPLPDTVSFVADIVPLPHGLAVAGHTVDATGAQSRQVVLYRENGHRSWVTDTPHGANAHITAIGGRLYALTETGDVHVRSSLYEQRVPGRPWRLLKPAPLPGEAQYSMVSTGRILWLVGDSVYRLSVASS